MGDFTGASNVTTWKRFPPTVCACTDALFAAAPFRKSPWSNPDLELLRPRHVLRRDVLLPGGHRGGAASHRRTVIDPCRPRCLLREIDRPYIIVRTCHRPGLVGVIVLPQVAILRNTVVMNRVQPVNVPIAFEALPITVFASWAAAGRDSAATSPRATTNILLIVFSGCRLDYVIVQG